ncbi:type VI secretion system baseplate subunit TssG [Duganella violaceipulchra]|uniref:Type VI secretion system baseplate subunit TssG n=1 Tax=Duganella violaceipulchra TaxID=2849652 RepID=A0AA41L425_9BURK|nr:type VI secretion system baseplate subunit TssG [Duganella violaceicalia]MBV6320457.1 type VI secretion system baseplate subunit TssG [Duganella violaceicalia]MCP2012292.1 type VI secretion system protein ImpH [Duganella violaceicalia]
MPTTKRRSSAGLVRQLLEEPHRFEFFQAVRIFERLLVSQGVPRNIVLTDYLQFRNSSSQNFPASQIEALDVEVTADCSGVTDEGELLAALNQGQFNRICITPTFFGLLGNHGVLPSHYGERLAAYRKNENHDGAHAFLDIFSNRLVALFYQAWKKHRLELPCREQADALMPLLLSLSGSKAQTLSDPVAAYYAAAFSQRPVSALMIERVLADYFKIPVSVQANTGRWHGLEKRHENRLGLANSQLDTGVILGARIWRRDLTATVRLGPLDKAQYDDFLAGGAGAVALRKVLAMFETPTLTYKIQLILRAEDVRGIQLSGSSSIQSARLGIDSFLLSSGACGERDDLYYLI